MKKVMLTVLMLMVCGLSADELQMLDQQIEQVRQQLHEARLSEMKKELDTQQYVKTEWKEYVDQVEKAEKDEFTIQLLKQQLKKLTDRKAEITKKVGE